MDESSLDPLVAVGDSLMVLEVWVLSKELSVKVGTKAVWGSFEPPIHLLLGPD